MSVNPSEVNMVTEERFGLQNKPIPNPLPDIHILIPRKKGASIITPETSLTFPKANPSIV